MKNNKNIIDFSNYSEIQRKTIIALLQSCENKSINMDKFIMWVSKNYNPGTSIFLNLIKSSSNMKPKRLILFPRSQVKVIYEDRIKARPLLMKPWGIDASLKGYKTHTRRVIKIEKNIKIESSIKCPYGKPGDLLYIKEPYYQLYRNNKTKLDVLSHNPFKVSDENLSWRKKSSLFMPREAARIWLLIENILVERVQDIKIWDVKKEGIDSIFCTICNHKKKHGCTANSIIDCFHFLWDEINGNRKDKQGNRLPYSWNDNPWVWVIVYRLFFQVKEEVNKKNDM